MATKTVTRPSSNGRSAALARTRSSARAGPEIQRYGTLRQLPIGLPDAAKREELRAAQRDPRRLDDPVLAVQEAPLARRRPDLLPAPPAVRQARRGAERAHRPARRARPEPGWHRRRRSAPRRRADDDPAAARRRRGRAGHDRPDPRGPRDRHRQGPRRRSRRPRSPRTGAPTTCSWATSCAATSCRSGSSPSTSWTCRSSTDPRSGALSSGPAQPARGERIRARPRSAAGAARHSAHASRGSADRPASRAGSVARPVAGRPAPARGARAWA